jgi:hypothetical protein
MCRLAPQSYKVAPATPEARCLTMRSSRNCIATLQFRLTLALDLKISKLATWGGDQ